MTPFLAACAGILVYFAYNRLVFGGIVPVSAAMKQIWSQQRWEEEGGYSLTKNLQEVLEIRVFDHDARSPIRIRTAPDGSIHSGNHLYLGEQVLVHFEDGFDGWLPDSEAVTNHGRHEHYKGQQPISGNAGRGFLTSYHPDKGDRAIGRALSPQFTARAEQYIVFLIAGGRGGGVGLRLLADGDEAAVWRGENTERFNRVVHPLAEVAGQRVQLEWSTTKPAAGATSCSTMSCWRGNNPKSNRRSRKASSSYRRNRHRSADTRQGRIWKGSFNIAGRVTGKPRSERRGKRRRRPGRRQRPAERELRNRPPGGALVPSAASRPSAPSSTRIASCVASAAATGSASTPCSTSAATSRSSDGTGRCCAPGPGSGGRIEREHGLGRGRTDLLILWPSGEGGSPELWSKCVVECKVWHEGRRRSLEGTIREGVEQTLRYMDRCGSEAGHLVVFDRTQGKQWEEKVCRREVCRDGRTIVVWGM